MSHKTAGIMVQNRHTALCDVAQYGRYHGTVPSHKTAGITVQYRHTRRPVSRYSTVAQECRNLTPPLRPLILASFCVNGDGLPGFLTTGCSVGTVAMPVTGRPGNRGSIASRSGVSAPQPTLHPFSCVPILPRDEMA